MPIYPIKNNNKIDEGYSFNNNIVYINEIGKRYKLVNNRRQYLTTTDLITMSGHKNILNMLEKMVS